MTEQTMIKVSVMYPNQPAVRFDHDYYRTKHLPLIKYRMGAALKYYSIDKALMDDEGKPLGAYVAMCHLFCDSLGAYKASFGPHAEEIRADIRNFTEVTSIHQISEVVVENSAIGAFSSESLSRTGSGMGTGSRQEKASKQKARASVPIQSERKRL
jgi:uncharacterized protein (TIGR02118 family)